MIDTVLNMLQENDLCVLCTESQGMPHCSLMTYLLGPEGNSLFLVTSVNSRKYNNLMENKNVSVLIDSRQNLEAGLIHPIKSVTFDGEFSEVDQTQLEAIRTEFLAQHSELEEIFVRDDCKIFNVRLKSYLLLDGPVQVYQGTLKI